MAEYDEKVPEGVSDEALEDVSGGYIPEGACVIGRVGTDYVCSRYGRRNNKKGKECCGTCVFMGVSFPMCYCILGRQS